MCSSRSTIAWVCIPRVSGICHNTDHLSVGPTGRFLKVGRFDLCFALSRSRFARGLFIVGRSLARLTWALKDIHRQVKLEVDAVHDGIVRYSQSREYQLA